VNDTDGLDRTGAAVVGVAPKLCPVRGSDDVADLPALSNTRRVAEALARVHYDSPTAAQSAETADVPLEVWVRKMPTCDQNKQRKKLREKGEAVDAVPFTLLPPPVFAMMGFRLVPTELDAGTHTRTFSFAIDKEFVDACRPALGVPPAAAKNDGFRQALQWSLRVPGHERDNIVRSPSSATDGYIVLSSRNASECASDRVALDAALQRVPARIAGMQATMEAGATAKKSKVFSQTATKLSNAFVHVDDDRANSGPMYCIWWEKNRDKGVSRQVVANKVKDLRSHTWRITFAALAMELHAIGRGQLLRCGVGRSVGGGSKYDDLQDCDVDPIFAPCSRRGIAARAGALDVAAAAWAAAAPSPVPDGASGVAAEKRALDESVSSNLTDSGGGLRPRSTPAKVRRADGDPHSLRLLAALASSAGDERAGAGAGAGSSEDADM